MSIIDSEIDVLRSIYEDELEVDHQSDPNQPVSLHIKVKPNEESGTSSFVKVNFILPTNYPEVSPKVTITNPRGISDGGCRTLVKEVEKFVCERVGELVIFDVLQLCAEFLVQNQQSDESICHICLDLLNTQPVTVTSCEHYLHEYCFKRYVVHRQEALREKLNLLPKIMQHTVELTLHCPVCREVIDENMSLVIEKNRSSRPTKQDARTEKFEFDWVKWRKELSKMNAIFMKQKEKGGIIDEEEEKMKNVITAETTVEVPIAPVNETVPDGAAEPSTSIPIPSENSQPNRKNHNRSNYRGRWQRSKHPRNK